jgi:CDP-diacylglycerol pyrophosphatase
MRIAYRLLFSALLALPGVALADADALWHIVHDQCTAHLARNGVPTPCAALSADGRYAVLKSIEGRMQYLLIPTDRVSGIESPALLHDGVPDYFARAWDARVFMERQYGRAIPREDLALTINSSYGRSQNQLHIHISCVTPTLKARLADESARIGSTWTPLPGGLGGKPYWARSVDQASLDGVLPFRDLAAHLPGARADMGAFTLAAVAVKLPGGRDGFVLLADRARPLALDFASSEGDVQDHRCTLLPAVEQAQESSRPAQ